MTTHDAWLSRAFAPRGIEAAVPQLFLGWMLTDVTSAISSKGRSP